MAIENALYKFIYSFILAAVALLQLCGRELDEKNVPLFSRYTHQSNCRKASAQFANKAT